MSKNQNFKAVEFWEWFEANNKNFLFINEVVDADERERLLDFFLEALHKYNNELYFEMGGDPKAEKVELVISAQGVVAQFESVEHLCAHAPDLKDWEIIAFKPAMGIDFSTRVGERNFDPNKIIFIPLESEEDPDWIAIEVCYPDFVEEDKNDFIFGTYLMLDVLLGEKSAAIDIHYLEVIATPDDIADYPFMHLSEIKDYVDSMKNPN